MTDENKPVAKEDLYQLRAGKMEDLNFIIISWLKGLYYGSEFYREIPWPTFKKNYEAYLKRLLAKDSILVAVAALKSNADVILGYSITEEIQDKNVVHWVYVKEDFRRIGIAKDLLPSKLDVCTHLTSMGKQLKPKSVVFDPFFQ